VKQPQVQRLRELQWLVRLEPKSPAQLGPKFAGAAGAEVAGAAGAWVVAAGLQAANKKASMNTTDITRETFLNIQSP